MSKAQLRTLEAVRNGLVTHRFDKHGNVYICPPGFSPRVCRQLEADGLIEDAPNDGRLSYYKQQLTGKGRAALAPPLRGGK